MICNLWAQRVCQESSKSDSVTLRISSESNLGMTYGMSSKGDSSALKELVKSLEHVEKYLFKR